MKRVVFIAICILGLLSFCSCRSTSQSCGLSDNTPFETSLEQTNNV